MLSYPHQCGHPYGSMRSFIKKKNIKLFLGTQGNIDTIANISLHEMLESLYFSIYYLLKQLVLAIIKLEFVNHCISGRYKKYV